MESPVRICLGVALVVNLLLLSGTPARGHTLPNETTPTIKDDRQPRSSRTNTTWISRTKPKTPDVALNELQHKDTSSEENTEKNAKYKDRGRVRFNLQAKSTTESSLRRIKSSTEASNVIIVTPTPDVKKPLEIIDSMHNYKKTKLPLSSSTESISTKVDQEENDEYDDDDTKSVEKYTSSKFSDSNFFNIPNYGEDHGYSEKHNEFSEKQKFKDTPSFFGSTFGDDFSNFFSKQSYKTDKEPYKTDSFFDFDSELTTPKNDFFDKKYKAVSSGILKNLDTIKAKMPQPTNGTNVHKTVESLSNGSPNNQSRVIIKNTKEIRLTDNDEAGTNTKALSDVHGTSIYYEMSVLSTETYNISHSNDDDEDDCDNDALPTVTQSTPLREELASLSSTHLPIIELSTPSMRQKDNEIGSTMSSYFLPGSMSPTILNTGSAIPISFQNTIMVSEKPSIQETSYSSENPNPSLSTTSRSRNYSKRLNLTGAKETASNIVIQKEQISPNLVYRQNTRRFHYTTPKTKPVWMAPRRNITRKQQTRAPSTIYSEHFDITGKYSTQEPTLLSKVLTTLSSNIDPVLQSDSEASGGKRVVHSHSFVDNKIPSLWKRGSTKFSAVSSTSSTTTSTTTIEPPTTLPTRSSINDLEIPPTLTAWALASLRSPPSPWRPGNITSTTNKNVDENELQKVGDIIEKRETSTSTSTTTMNSPSSSTPDFVSKNITEIDQNKLPWRPFVYPTLTSKNVADSVSERVPAESNISLQSSEEVSTTPNKASEIPEQSEIDESQSSWFATTADLDNSQTAEAEETSQNIQSYVSIEPTRSTGFESITKLPSDITTPSDDTIANSDEKSEVIASTTKTNANEYEITTIRFSYVPTEKVTDNTETDDTTTEWYYAGPTKQKITTTIQDAPITTYRPKYHTTDTEIEETTTIQDTTPQIEVSSQIMEKTTTNEPTTTEVVSTTSKILLYSTTEVKTVATTTELPTTMKPTTTEKPTTEAKSNMQEATTELETTSIVVTIATEINTEKATMVTEIPTTMPSEAPTETQSKSEENIDFNEVITQDTPPVTETKSTKPVTTTESAPTTVETTTEVAEETTTEALTTTTKPDANIVQTTENIEETTTETEEVTSKPVNDLEDLTSYGGEMTTESSSRVLDEAGSGAAIAIAVSTIGVIALVLLIGLLIEETKTTQEKNKINVKYNMVENYIIEVLVRRRGRRGVYAQRCTPVSLDAYSLDSVSVGHRKGQRLRASKRSYGNPAYDDEVTSHPMNYAALANFALDIDSITAEFAEIPTVTVRPEEVPPGCEDKNRYSNVLPLPETRVPLKRLGNDPTTEYINANYITGPGNIKNYYIACQAPLSNTVVDFWRMIWEQNSRLIVMLTEYMENGVEKCYEYLPPSEISDNRRTFGDFQIILKKREQRDKYAVSSVQLINLATRTWREVTHLWYFWPAKGVPDDYDSVIDFLSEMRSYMKISQTAKEYDEEGLEVIYEDQNRSSYNNLSKLRSEDNSSGNGVNVYSPAKAEELLRRGYSTNGTLGKMKVASEVEGVRPCVVVCASGAGRSAALIAADICARALCAGAADLPRAVRAIRGQRPHSISNRHHYIFLYKLLSEYGNRLMGVDTI